MRIPQFICQYANSVPNGKVQRRTMIQINCGLLDRPSHWADNDQQSLLPKIAEATRKMARLLLIDDDPELIAEQVRSAFPASVHRLDVACTGSQGLQQVVASPPDVVLLDLRLPDLSGLE